jgi:hypothetical protein
MRAMASTAEFVVKTVRRDAARGVTTRKKSELQELAIRFARARALYVDSYWDPRFLTTVCDSRKRVVQSQRRSGWLASDLSPHQNKVSLEATIAILRAG